MWGKTIKSFGQLLNARSVRLGLLIAALSAAVFIFWISVLNPDICLEIERARHWLSDNALKAHLIFFAWCFVLSLTIIPLGSTTVMVGGALLGPAAGLDLYLGCIFASIILFETGRDQDPSALYERIKGYPRLTKLAGFCRDRGLSFTLLTRVLPVLPNAMAALAACYFHLSRWQFYLGTLLGA